MNKLSTVNKWLLILTGEITIITGGIVQLHQSLNGYPWNWNQLGGWHHETIISACWIIGYVLFIIGLRVEYK